VCRAALLAGGRAEFGLLKPGMRAIDVDARLELETVVTGLHLAAKTQGDVMEAFFSSDATGASGRRRLTG